MACLTPRSAKTSSAPPRMASNFLGDTSATPDLYRFVGNLMGSTGSAHLEQTDGASEVLRLLLVRHVAHLVSDGLEPGLVGLNECDHLGNPTLVVKVAKNDLDTLVLLAQHILSWHLDVIERHTDLLLAAEDLIGNLLLPHLIASEVEDSCQADGHTSHVAICKTSGHSPRKLLCHDQIMEVVKFLALDRTSHEIDTMQVLSRTNAHVQNAQLAHAIDHLLADVASSSLALLRLGVQLAIDKLPELALQSPVAVVVVGRTERLCKPQGLGVRDLAEVTGLRSNDLGLLALDGTNGEVLVFCENLVSVEVVESGCGILTGNLSQDSLTTRMRVNKVCQVVDCAIDDAPQRLVGGMRADLLAGKGV
ncbi:hypothetical protein HG530_007507 [Fusarium avenaceum]|nr:hypothetical protein HG530_007507 [Fusarium avenaceum]